MVREIKARIRVIEVDGERQPTSYEPPTGSSEDQFQIDIKDLLEIKAELTQFSMIQEIDIIEELISDLSILKPDEECVNEIKLINDGNELDIIYQKEKLTNKSHQSSNDEENEIREGEEKEEEDEEEEEEKEEDVGTKKRPKAVRRSIMKRLRGFRSKLETICNILPQKRHIEREREEEFEETEENKKKLGELNQSINTKTQELAVLLSKRANMKSYKKDKQQSSGIVVIKDSEELIPDRPNLLFSRAGAKTSPTIDKYDFHLARNEKSPLSSSRWKQRNQAYH